MHNDRRSTNVKQSTSEIAALDKHGFKLTTKLGQGGYGKVYLADYNSIKNEQKHKLACKIIDSIKDKVLPQELKILTKLNHPHIIEIHSIFQRKNKYYIFMRYAENGDLLDFILNEGPVKEQLAKIWVRQLSLAIQYLHILQISHRDIKCENILITVSNHVKLADFGFSRSVVDSNNQSILSETYCGSVSYASPQILMGVPYLPKATDMWSLGCVIYIMLNKAFPFESKNMKSMINDQMSKNYKFRSKYISRYGNDIIGIVSGLLEPKENLRIQIDQVLGSVWITMDAALRVLNKREFSALTRARVIANYNENEHASKNITPNIMTKTASSHKKVNDAFDLNSIKSTINTTHKRLST